MNIKDIRMKNINAICDHYGRDIVAKKMGYPDTVYINQLCRGLVSFGSRTARKLEASMSLRHGWMDVEHDSGDPDVSNYLMELKEILARASAGKRAAILEYAHFQDQRDNDERTPEP